MLRAILAPNASPMTLDGTRTFLVGERRVVVIDPGPDMAAHLNAVADAIGNGVLVAILVTHDHADHAQGAAPLAERFRAPIRMQRAGTLDAQDRIDTDAGPLIAIKTPGHTPDHFAFHWPAEQAVFCGDLMMGGLDTALVAPPEGDLTDYLHSLQVVRSLQPRVIHPAHGPSFTDPEKAVATYVEHRKSREQQVLAALESGAQEPDDIVTAVYGAALHPELREAARAAVQAYIEHLERSDRLGPLLRHRGAGRQSPGSRQNGSDRD
jgi:glyoxylase-like metal-dependent hydrolase (beta-lactamase superfamily II)